MISVIIPVRNGGEDLRRCLEAIRRQEAGDEVEIVVVDSSSTDGSAELARTLGARVEVIPVEVFNHGATRNLGAELAKGDVLIFTSQDAAAVGDELARAADCSAQDERVAGVYGRQLAIPAPASRALFPRLSVWARARVQEAAGVRRALDGDHDVLERQCGDPSPDLRSFPLRRRHRHERGPGMGARGS